MNENDQVRYLRAKEKVEGIRSFYIHALVFVVVMSAMAYVNYSSTPYPWVLFPLAGWGIGLCSHAMRVYGFMPFLGRKWEERKIKEYMDRESD